ncbi:MAG: hypothetical protein JJ959_06865 [Nisaea sp.]|uniref:hypothetical protein n=1 Tax=Nisaea sp. TaxID=2024842 RepID=UPI001B212A22|nr:hypothetical protein [Nisaea sp.]MBO6560240.1 hypothetical protein [Nisaea sp.]
MRPFIRSLGLMAVLFGLSGCTASVVAGSAWVATEAYADKTPFDYMAEFFERDCAHMTIYDQPPRCRR